MKRFARYFAIGTTLGVIIGLPLLGFKWVSLTTLLVDTALVTVGAVIGGGWVFIVHLLNTK